MTITNAKKLEEDIKNFCIDGDDNLYFFGSGTIALQMLTWLKERNLPLPIGICDNNKATSQDSTRQYKTVQDSTRQYKTRQDKTRQDKTRQDKTRQDKTRQDIPTLSFQEACLAHPNLKILITSTTFGHEIEKQVLEKLSNSCVLNISTYFENPFLQKERLYINSLRGQGDIEQFTLRAPDDMPDSAREIVAQLKSYRALYADNIDIPIDINDHLMHGIGVDFWKRYGDDHFENRYRLIEFLNRPTYRGIRKIGENFQSLVGVELEKPDDNVKAVENFSDFYSYLSKKGIKFLYVQCPNKLSSCDILLPEGVVDYKNQRTTEIMASLSHKGVPHLDFRQYMKDHNLCSLDCFFKTDHHWKPSLAFTASKAICDTLNTMGCDFDMEQFSRDRYHFIHYSDIFLGIHGKKTGILYGGLDDFELIIPKSDTIFSWSCEEKNFKNEGKYSTISPHRLDYCYYETNPYAVYNLVTFHYTVIKNKYQPDLPKVVFLCDSFSNPFATFLSPHFSEIHFLDLRKTLGKKELFEIIDKVKPDLVISAYWVNALVAIPKATNISPLRDY